MPGPAEPGRQFWFRQSRSWCLFPRVPIFIGNGNNSTTLHLRVGKIPDTGHARACSAQALHRAALGPASPLSVTITW